MISFAQKSQEYFSKNKGQVKGQFCYERSMRYLLEIWTKENNGWYSVPKKSRSKDSSWDNLAVCERTVGMLRMENQIQ